MVKKNMKEDIIIELMAKYGDSASIEVYHTKVKKKEVIRYRFVNVPIMARFPYGFKSMNYPPAKAGGFPLQPIAHKEMYMESIQ